MESCLLLVLPSFRFTTCGAVLSYCSHSVSVRLDSSHPPPSSSCSLVSLLPSRSEASESVPFPFSPELSRRPPSSPFEWGKWLSWYGERSYSDIPPFPSIWPDIFSPAYLFLFLKSFFSSQPLLCHHVVIVSQLHLIHCLFNRGWITQSYQALHWTGWMINCCRLQALAMGSRKW